MLLNQFFEHLGHFIVQHGILQKVVKHRLKGKAPRQQTIDLQPNSYFSLP